jgi:hypothetical protein
MYPGAQPDGGHAAAAAAPVAYVAGLLVGLALRQGELLARLRLSPFLVRALVRPLSTEPPTLADLESVDPEYAHNLRWVLEHSIMPPDAAPPSAPASSTESTPFTSPTLVAATDLPTQRVRLRRRRLAPPPTAAATATAVDNQLGLTFSVTSAVRAADVHAAPTPEDDDHHHDDEDGPASGTAMVVIPLVPGGEDVSVNDDNKGEYVAAVVRYHLIARTQRRLDAFCAGTHPS